MSLHVTLNDIQVKLNAGKDKVNAFAGFNYRSAEGILEAVKPLLGGSTVLLSDDVVEVGGRIYVKATAALGDGENVIQVTAFARETLSRKGMDEAQITGSASSYARKYALSGLFAIDNNDDVDAMEAPEPVDYGHAAQQTALDEAVARHEVSIDAIRTGIAANDLQAAAEAWNEIPNDDKNALWKAPTKFDNPAFSTAERKAMQSSEWTEARKAVMGSD